MGITIGNEYNYLNYSTNTSATKNTGSEKNNSVTSQEESSNTSTEKNNNHHLNGGTIKFVMENGMAEAADVDGIRMSITDLFSRDKSQLKERINEEYNKTDAEKLEEIFEL